MLRVVIQTNLRAKALHSFIRCLFQQRKATNESSPAFSPLLQSYLSWQALLTGILLRFYVITLEIIEQKHCFDLNILLTVVTVRDAKHTNFVEFRNFKIVYRRY